MFVVWLIALVLALLAPLALALVLWRLFGAATRPAAARVLLGGTLGAVAGFAFSMAVGFISERGAIGLAEYWYAQVAAGFTLGVGFALLVLGLRAARKRAASAF